MAEINWTQEAQSWLKDIYDYIAIDNPEAAVRTVQGIYETAQILNQHSEVGYRHETRTDRRSEFSSTVTYRITYLIKPDGNIDILGVFHGALDIDRYLV